MKHLIALLSLLLPVAAYADDAPGVVRDSAVIQSQLSARIGEEMNKAISCEVQKERTDAALRDADQAQDELQDDGD